MTSKLNDVSKMIREKMMESGYTMMSDYTSEFKITESFWNEDTKHRVCIKLVEEVE